MTIHYHGTPLSPVAKLYELAGRHFCVPFPRPDDVHRCHQIGQSVMLDNGAFSAWKRGIVVDWRDYYRWCEEWLQCPTSWAVIPDVIGGGHKENDALLTQWPLALRGAPVWHMEHDIKRLLMLADTFDKVCIGSSAIYSVVMSETWKRRMDEAWNALIKLFGATPWLHMLRGMQVAGERWPFASLDSTDIARNHNRPHNSPRAMADRWDAVQCPIKWEPQPEQMELIA